MTRNPNMPRLHNKLVTQLATEGGPKQQPGELCPRHHIPIKPGMARCAKGKKKGENCR